MSHGPIPHSYWVVPGLLLAGEYPVEHGAAEESQQLDRLLDAGIDCFINLTQRKELAAYEQILPANIRHLQLPLPDHDIPKRTECMREILAALKGELADGRRVYVHCRAGIGRTGTVMGCYLVEQGMSGEAALTELNRLWQQNALSSIWGEIPETAEQRQYVLRWAGNARASSAESDTVVQSLRERFLGAIVGLAVGDALAAATQFRKVGSFTPVGDVLGGGPYELPRGAWSDDTAMALCLADSLVVRGGSVPEDQLERYVRWKTRGYLSATGQCVGITASTAKALARVQWRKQSFAASHDPAQSDPEALSRVAPAVLHGFGDPELALMQVRDATRVTSQSPVVLDGCRLLGAMLLAALQGESKDRLLAPAGKFLGKAPLRAEVAALMADPKATQVLASRHPAGDTITAALAVARLALAHTSSFRDGALYAVNAGGNSDVVGAVFGQVAGAHYGYAAIPQSWREALVQRAAIEGLADKLLTAALVRLADATPLPR